jgi:hypothetical protein
MTVYAPEAFVDGRDVKVAVQQIGLFDHVLDCRTQPVRQLVWSKQHPGNTANPLSIDVVIATAAQRLRP